LELPNRNKSRKNNGFRSKPWVEQMRYFLQWQGNDLKTLRDLVKAHKLKKLDVFEWVHERVKENEDKGATYGVDSDDGIYVTVVHPSNKGVTYRVNTMGLFWTCPCNQPEQQYVLICLLECP
jgi:hypothetical protein